jgi:hypothetical protein
LIVFSTQERKMETFIVYIDDKQYALQQLVPMLQPHGVSAAPARWVLVGCPPSLNRHTGRWLTRTAQKKWRQQWTQATTAEVVRLLETSGNSVSVRTAHGSLLAFTQQLKGELGNARVMDARRPKLAVHLAAVTPGQPQEPSHWAVPSGMLAMGAAMVMVSD